MFRRRWLTAFIMIAAAFVLVTADAHARPLSGLSAGSRGMRTYSAPPSTAALNAAPIRRSMTQPLFTTGVADLRAPRHPV